MPKLSTKEVLIYLYAKHRKWDEVYKAITDKEELPSNISICKKAIEDFKKEIPSARIAVITDDEMPKSLNRRVHPPFLIRYEGDITLLDKDQLIALDCSPEQLPDVPVAMAKKGARIVALRTDPLSLLVFAPTKDGEIKKLVVYDEDIAHSLLTMATIADRFVSLEGHDEFANMANAAGHGIKYAAPGPSGCVCNQLIKNGWHLCDCVEDFLYMEPPKYEIEKETKSRKEEDDGED